MRATSSPSSSLTKMRSAWNVRVAGWISPGRERTTDATISASARGVAIGALERALTMARATARECRSSPRVKIILARSRSLAAVDNIGRARAFAAHAHVERARRGGKRIRARPCRAAWRRRRDRAPRRRPCRSRHRARSRRGWKTDPRSASAGRSACSTRSAPKRDGGLVAVDADHFAVGGRQDGARIAAGAEGAVDIDAAVTRLEETRPRGGRARECGGLVRQRQPSRRRPPSFPCSERVARRHLGTQLAL